MVGVRYGSRITVSSVQVLGVPPRQRAMYPLPWCLTAVLLLILEKEDVKIGILGVSCFLLGGPSTAREKQESRYTFLHRQT